MSPAVESENALVECEAALSSRVRGLGLGSSCVHIVYLGKSTA